VTEARVCEQLAQGCYLKVERPGVEPAAEENPVGGICRLTSVLCVLKSGLGAEKSIWPV